MAKEAKAEESAEVAAPPRKSKKLMIIVAAAVVLVLLIGGGAAFFLMKGHAAKDGEDGEVATASKTDKKKGGKEVAPVYVALDAFTVNLVPESGDQFLQLVLSVEVSDLHVGERLKSYTPKLRNNVMLLLSGKKASELVTREGKETLANEIRDLINEVLEPGSKDKPDEAPVKEVLFTSFIIQ
jgi:flagellar FliL protein